MNKSIDEISVFIKFLKTISKICLLFLAVFLYTKESHAQTTITIEDADLGTGTYNWTNNNTYLLDGFVYLESGGVLNIQEGTIIKGKATPSTGDNASALIITAGAQINAIGTFIQPIIMTSEIDDLSDPFDLIATDRGLWGGLILLGDGILGNPTTTSNIEGIPTTEPRAQFGGSNNTNNAGTLKYVSIKHGGAELAPGDEINGLTLGGEWDGAKPDGNLIYSNPTVYNLSFIGSGTGSVAATNTNAILMRDATGGTVTSGLS